MFIKGKGRADARENDQSASRLLLLGTSFTSHCYKNLLLLGNFFAFLLFQLFIFATPWCNSQFSFSLVGPERLCIFPIFLWRRNIWSADLNLLFLHRSDRLDRVQSKFCILDISDYMFLPSYALLSGGSLTRDHLLGGHHR